MLDFVFTSYVLLLEFESNSTSSDGCFVAARLQKLLVFTHLIMEFATFVFLPCGLR